VPKLSGVNHLQAIRALEKRGFNIIRQGKHVILSDGTRTVVVPRNNPINPFTMGYIVKESGTTIQEFRKLL
jgi:predicted RNA binding protein YcfA (HicA-like mRNA interferase family)